MVVDAFADTAFADAVVDPAEGHAAEVVTSIHVYYAARPVTHELLAPYGTPWVDYVPDGAQGMTLLVPGPMSDIDQMRVKLLLALPPWVPPSTVNAIMAAYQTDEAYLAIVTPSQTQAVAQVAALTRQMRQVLLHLANLDDGSL